MSEKCISRFRATKPLQVHIKDRVYLAMEKIEPTSNPRVLRYSEKNDTADVEYDWNGPAHFDVTYIVVPLDLEVVKDWKGNAANPFTA